MTCPLCGRDLGGAILCVRGGRPPSEHDLDLVSKATLDLHLSSTGRKRDGTPVPADCPVVRGHERAREARLVAIRELRALVDELEAKNDPHDAARLGMTRHGLARLEAIEDLEAPAAGETG